MGSGYTTYINTCISQTFPFNTVIANYQSNRNCIVIFTMYTIYIYAQTQTKNIQAVFLRWLHFIQVCYLFYSSSFQGLLTYSPVYLPICFAFVLLQLQFSNFASKREVRWWHDKNTRSWYTTVSVGKTAYSCQQNAKRETTKFFCVAVSAKTLYFLVRRFSLRV